VAARSSRRLHDPVAEVIRSHSAAEAPSLIDTVLSLWPEGCRLKLSALVVKQG
jgi:hypothetical protein